MMSQSAVSYTHLRPAEGDRAFATYGYALQGQADQDRYGAVKAEGYRPVSYTHLDVYKRQALHGVNMDIKENSVTALIGPSGCGKSTFLKCINRKIGRAHV